MKGSTVYSLALETLAELAPEINASGTDVGLVLPTLAEALGDFSPLPREALFLGIAEDGLPVLLNLYDPLPGPLLVCADAGAGKTAFLQLAAKAVASLHDAEAVQFGAVTAYPEEWKGFDQSAHCAGIFPADHPSAAEFILSLGEWAHGNRSRQSVVLLMDDLSRVEGMEAEVRDTLRWLLLRGPARRLWPIVSLNPARAEDFLPWLELFHTRIFGQIKEGRLAGIAAASARGELASLVAGAQFAMREGPRWLRFWIPRLDEGAPR